MNVALIGMPGSGKTETGRALASSLGMRHVDTDEEIERTFGPVEVIFAGPGEGRFREIELETVESLFPADGLVVSTGGGCVETPGCVESLRENCIVVYLRAGTRALKENLRRAGRRPGPLLTGDMDDGVERLFRFRSPLYEAAADITVDTDGLGPGEAAENIMGRLEGLT